MKRASFIKGSAGRMVLVAAALLALLVCAQAQDTAEDWFKKGTEAKTAGDAAEAFDKAAEMEPENATYWYAKGDALMVEIQVTGDEDGLDDAIDAYEKVTELSPDNPLGWRALGIALVTAKKYDEAIDAYDRALEISPDNPLILLDKANSLMEAGREDDADEVYSQILEIEPNNDDQATTLYAIVMETGAARASQEDLDGAVDAYDRAIEINPDFLDAYISKAGALQSAGRNEDAINTYDEVAEKFDDPGAKGLALLRKGDLQLAMGDSDEANETLEEALKNYDEVISENKESYLAWKDKGFTLLDLGRNEEALDAFEESIDLTPDDAEAVSAPAWIGKGMALEAMGQDDEAEEAYDKADELTGQ